MTPFRLGRVQTYPARQRREVLIKPVKPAGFALAVPAAAGDAGISAWPVDAIQGSWRGCRLAIGPLTHLSGLHAIHTDQDQRMSAFGTRLTEAE
jgi:hypothetical protein